MSIKHVPVIAKLFCFVISIAMDFIIRQKKNLARAEATFSNSFFGLVGPNQLTEMGLPRDLSRAGVLLGFMVRWVTDNAWDSPAGLEGWPEAWAACECAHEHVGVCK